MASTKQETAAERITRLEAELGVLKGEVATERAGAERDRATALQKVVDELVTPKDFGPSKNGKDWFGAYVKTSEVELSDGRKVTVALTFTDVAHTKALKDAHKRS